MNEKNTYYKWFYDLTVKKKKMEERKRSKRSPSIKDYWLNESYNVPTTRNAARLKKEREVIRYMIIRRRMRQFYSSLFLYTVHMFFCKRRECRDKNEGNSEYSAILLNWPIRRFGYVRLKTINLVRRVRIFFKKRKEKKNNEKRNLIVCICLRDMPLQSDSKMLPLAL